MSAHETTSSGDLVAPEGRRQDVFAILTLTATVLLTLALISYDARNGSANLVGPVVSRYLWEGRLERAEETLMVLKTRRALVAELTARLADWHPYDVPEVLEVPVRSGLEAYLAWVDASCRPTS